MVSVMLLAAKYVHIPCKPLFVFICALLCCKLAPVNTADLLLRLHSRTTLVFRFQIRSFWGKCTFIIMFILQTLPVNT